MWPSEIPSDLDVDDVSSDELTGRWSILVDLYSEFQGAFGAYAFFAVLASGLIIASRVFGWAGEERGTAVSLLIAGAIFVACASISLNSWIWYRWVKKRMKRIEELMKTAD